MEYRKRFKIDIENKNNINPRFMSIKNMDEYLRSNYIDVTVIDKEKIITDLVIFKAYEGEIEKNIRRKNYFNDFMSSVMTVFITVITSSMLQDTKSLIQIIDKLNLNTEFSSNVMLSTPFEDLLIVIEIIILYTLLRYVILLMTTGRYSDSSRKVTVNKIIHTLEAIKENLIEVHQTREFDIVTDNLIGQVSEPRKYFVRVKESLEDAIELLDEEK